MFFFKPKTIVVDCLTADHHVYEHARIDHAKKFIPKWWRDIPLPDKSQFAPKKNMRFCSGFIDYYMNGFIIPLWSDLSMEVGALGTREYKWYFSDEKSTSDYHEPYQWGSFFSPEEFMHMKLQSPWRMKSKRSLKFHWSEPTWNMLNDDFRVLPANLDFKYQTTTNVNFVLPRKAEPYVKLLPFMTPLVHLAPMTEHNVKIKHHLVSREEIAKLDSPRFKFTSKYYFNKTLKDKKRCPFHNWVS